MFVWWSHSNPVELFENYTKSHRNFQAFLMHSWFTCLCVAIDHIMSVKIGLGATYELRRVLINGNNLLSLYLYFVFKRFIHNNNYSVLIQSKNDEQKDLFIKMLLMDSAFSLYIWRTENKGIKYYFDRFLPDMKGKTVAIPAAIQQIKSARKAFGMYHLFYNMQSNHNLWRFFITHGSSWINLIIWIIIAFAKRLPIRSQWKKNKTLQFGQFYDSLKTLSNEQSSGNKKRKENEFDNVYGEHRSITFCQLKERRQNKIVQGYISTLWNSLKSKL
jgi:hypothetical protein